MPLQAVCSVRGEEFLQKFSMHLSSVSNVPWPQGVDPKCCFILQCEMKNLSLIKSGKEWHNVRLITTQIVPFHTLNTPLRT